MLFVVRFFHLSNFFHVFVITFLPHRIIFCFYFLLRDVDLSGKKKKSSHFIVKVNKNHRKLAEMVSGPWSVAEKVLQNAGYVASPNQCQQKTKMHDEHLAKNKRIPIAISMFNCKSHRFKPNEYTHFTSNLCIYFMLHALLVDLCVSSVTLPFNADWSC